MIKKSIVTTSIFCCGFERTEEGLKPVELKPITSIGKLSEKKCLQEAKKIYANIEGLTVEKIETTIENYQMTVEDFIHVANKIETDVKAN